MLEQQQRLLTVEDISLILGRSKDTVKRMFRNQVIPGVKIGGHWYIPQQDWNHYLNDLMQKETRLEAT